MINYKITLTERKPYSQYSKKISKNTLIVSAIMIFIYILFFGFHLSAIVLIFLISGAGVYRFYSGDMYFNEPFFMIQNDAIKYRFKEYGSVKEINLLNISRISIKDSVLLFFDINEKITKVNLRFIPDKYAKEIIKQLNIFAYEKNIAIDK